MENFICIAKFQPKPQKHDELEARLKELVRLTRMEEGCVNYDLCLSNDSKFAFFVIEQFKTKADFEIHSKKDYLVRFIRDLEVLVANASVQICENAKQAS